MSKSRATSLAIVAAVGSLVVGGTINVATADTPASKTTQEATKNRQDISPAANSSTFRLADPDTVRAKDGRYVTYGTTVARGVGKRCNARGKLNVPVLVHGSGNTVGLSDCAAADALPGGPGAWAKPGGAIWAPGVARHGNRYFMYYTASRKGSGQKCIGLAISNSARGPFRNHGGWACPSSGRWVLDANPYVAGNSLYVTYRDDAITNGAETGISTVRTNNNGRAIWNTRQDVLKSTDVAWDTKKSNTRAHVVENPSMWKMPNGRWYLMYSGNNWDSAQYSTGIARCGNSPLPNSRCEPIRRGVQRPYFGFTGNAGLAPYKGLPANRRGPGGMDVFRAANGGLRVVWHWWDGGPRYPMTGLLTRGQNGFSVR